jgi:hypothetical protein
MKLVIESVVESIKTRVDGSIVVSLSTQEIDPSRAATLFGFRGKFIKTLLSDTNITGIEEKLIDEEKVADGKKLRTKSQRLRSVLFRIWESVGEPGDFTNFYNEEMNKLIETFKQQLD